jgi:hypothetical protein
LSTAPWPASPAPGSSMPPRRRPFWGHTRRPEVPCELYLGVPPDAAQVIYTYVCATTSTSVTSARFPTTTPASTTQGKASSALRFQSSEQFKSAQWPLGEGAADKCPVAYSRQVHTREKVFAAKTIDNPDRLAYGALLSEHERPRGGQTGTQFNRSKCSTLPRRWFGGSARDAHPHHGQRKLEI